MSDRKRYAIVGTGGRCRMFIETMYGDHAAHAELVGLCDLSQTRMNYYNAEIQKEYKGAPVPTFAASDFDRMIAETKPHTVIVTTMDSTHHQYIVRAMERGCDAVTEKPMTIDTEKVRAIFDAVKRTGRKLRVSFNYRYQPGASQLRQLIAEGAIGRPTAVDFAWTLDTSHGADYFRRWHREKDKSGGLLIHKASHHFDLINWWIDSYPERVFAMGSLQFYGKANAADRGEQYGYDRYTGVAAAKDDPFALRLDERPSLKALYLDAEPDSGYVRDRNVFGEPITIEDTMAVTAKYQSGVILNYSLICYSPWEGMRVSITGTKGRVEYFDYHSSHIIAGQSDAELSAEQNKKTENTLTLFPMFGTPQKIEIRKGAGGHGGGDAGILDRIFNPDLPPDPLERDATHIDGAAAIVVGIAANRSMESGQAIDCDEIITLRKRSD